MRITIGLICASDMDVLTLYARAKVTAIQKAANDYTDTLTVVAAGLF